MLCRVIALSTLRLSTDRACAPSRIASPLSICARHSLRLQVRQPGLDQRGLEIAGDMSRHFAHLRSQRAGRHYRSRTGRPIAIAAST